jgi:uncharacterized protein (DUF342 family)
MNGGEGAENGRAWVKDGKVCVKNPGPGGRPATILPVKDIEIIVSGRKITAEEQITESSTIQVNLPHRSPSLRYLVEIIKGGLEAQARFDIQEGLKYKLIDQDPTERLVLRYETESEMPVPSPRELIEVMREAGIEYGIDRSAISAGCERANNDPFIVARGKPYVPGTDGEVEFVVPLERIVDLPADVLQVDFRETVKLPDVKQGQTIAVKKPPVPGTAGVAVTGASILPPRPKDPILRAGKGAVLREQDGMVLCIAEIAGCPMYAEESGTVSVDPVLTHRGDVDMASGNLRSSGSIAITGQVTEGMKVEAEGNLDISGAVTEATAKAWGSIRVLGNVFKSSVVAGKDSSWIQTMDLLLKSAEDPIAAILALEQPYCEAQARKEAGESALGDAEILDEGRQLEHFRDLAVAISAILKENVLAFPKEIAEKVKATRQALSSYGTGVFERTKGIAELLADARAHINEELLKGKSDIVLPYAQSSTIEASRDIMITGQGAFYSTLVAGRAIKVTGSPGLIRSGEARARELIQVNAAGGQGAAPTTLTVSYDGRIQANTIYPNTILKVGRFSFRTEDSLQAVKASIVSDRLIVVTASGSLEVQ